MGTLPRHLLAAFIVLVFTSLNCGLAQPLLDRVKSNKSVTSLSAETDATESTRQRPTPRPTFTPTPAYTDTPTNTPTPTITPIPTDTPTPAATDTPVATTTPLATATPPPTNTRRPAAPTATFTPAPPTSTPTPAFAFTLGEQGNREFQKTTYPQITIYIAIVDASNVPIGGLKIVGEDTSGKRVESALSGFGWTAVNCLGCNYIKQGNVKFEPGPMIDGTWNIYVAEKDGKQLSPKVALTYSSNPDKFVWDFIVFKKK